MSEESSVRRGSANGTEKGINVLADEMPRRSKDEEQQVSTTKPAIREGMNKVVWFLIVTGILSSILLYALDNTIMANVVPVVAKTLGETEKLPWLSVGFLIGALAAVLPVGRLYGLFDAKYLYCLSILLFLAGSALCGAAPTMNAFIVGRVIAGVGGCGLYFGVMTLISVNTDAKERPLYLGLTGVMFGVGTVAGPLLGGGFAQSAATWRWGFYLNLCVGGFFSPVYIFLLPRHDPQRGKGAWARLRQFDSLGATLSTASLSCLIIATNFGGTVYPWNSGQIITLFVVAGVTAIAFIVQQTMCIFTTARECMLPLKFLFRKEYTLLFVLMVLANTGFVAMYYIPYYLQFLKGDSPVSSAVHILPIFCFICGTIVISGGVMSKLGYYKPWYIGGAIFALAGAVNFALIKVDTSYPAIFGFEILLGIGIGATVQTGHAVMQAIVELEMLSYGITFMIFGQNLGLTLGLSIAGSIFVNIAMQELQTILPTSPVASIEAALLGVGSDFIDSLPADVKSACLDVIVATIRKVFILLCVSAGISLIVSLFVKYQKINMDVRDPPQIEEETKPEPTNSAQV